MNGGEDHLVSGLEEVLGPSELSRLAGGVEKSSLTALQQKMEECYGSDGARGVAICTGRAAFKHLVERNGGAIGFEDVDYRFSPIKVKIRKGLGLLAKWIETTYGLKVSVQNGTGDFYRFEVSGDQQSNPAKELPLCDFTSGLLQEFMAWTSGGKFYVVRETDCRRAGSACCNFQVGKSPVE
jgi:hypothetical protein